MRYLRCCEGALCPVGSGCESTPLTLHRLLYTLYFALHLTVRWVAIQEHLQKAQAEKRDLQEAVEQLRAQIAANQAGIVTAATEVRCTL